MVKKKVCKDCKLFYDGSECPNCKSNQTATSWKGRISILDTENSRIAKKIGIENSGEYAIKIR
ncbi:MAG: transcription elongation factor subunit Spt4 [Candidatus Woesearchaeota archaeon]